MFTTQEHIATAQRHSMILPQSDHTHDRIFRDFDLPSSPCDTSMQGRIYKGEISPGPPLSEGPPRLRTSNIKIFDNYKITFIINKN